MSRPYRYGTKGRGHVIWDRYKAKEVEGIGSTGNGTEITEVWDPRGWQSIKGMFFKEG